MMNGLVWSDGLFCSYRPGCGQDRKGQNMYKILMTTAAIALGASIASAQTTTDSIVQDLKDQGYTRIHVKTGATRIKVEALRDGEKLEVVYNRGTGEVLKREIGMAGADDGSGGMSGSDDSGSGSGHDGGSDDGGSDGGHDGGSDDGGSDDDH